MYLKAVIVTANDYFYHPCPIPQNLIVIWF
jgi:hypothetical protein